MRSHQPGPADTATLHLDPPGTDAVQSLHHIVRSPTDAPGPVAVRYVVCDGCVEPHLLNA